MSRIALSELNRLSRKAFTAALADVLYSPWIADPPAIASAARRVLASGEIFWGQDRLDMLERALCRDRA